MSAIKIIQPAGAGDILYCQKIAHHLCTKFDTVYWPIVREYDYFKNYLRSPRNLLFEEPEDKHIQAIDLQSASKAYPGVGIMQAKYALAGISPDGWQNAILLNRDSERELDLLYEFADIEDFPIAENPYALVCNEYATPPETFTATFTVNSRLPKIFINKIEGYNVFDWRMLIENATELHFVDTVFTYLAEIFQLKASVMRLYKRDKHESEIKTKGLWSKPWEYVE